MVDGFLGIADARPARPSTIKRPSTIPISESACFEWPRVGLLRNCYVAGVGERLTKEDRRSPYTMCAVSAQVLPKGAILRNRSYGAATKVKCSHLDKATFEH